MFCSFLVFVSIYFLLVPLHVNTQFPLIFLLVLVLFKTSHKGGWLGWVIVLATSTFWIQTICSQLFLVSLVFVIIHIDSKGIMELSFGSSIWCKTSNFEEWIKFSQIFSDSLLCNVCSLAKQKRLPFVSSNSLSSQPFNLVHHIWGPFTP